MRWRRNDLNIRMTPQTILIFTILTLNSLQTCHGIRRAAQRRRDLAPNLFVPAPSAESLTAIAQAVGAAGFEDYTEGKRTLVKRLIPPNSQPDLDIVEHLGVIGKANVDFPALPNIPNTGFNCKKVPTGYYADLETDCQVFHICDTSRKISFLCPNGTIFSQSHLICDWWFKVDCASAPALYEASGEYYSSEQRKAQRTRNPEQIGVGAESKRAQVAVPSTTERLLRHRQKLQTEPIPPTTHPTARSYQTLFDISTTQRSAATVFEKRRKNLVQLIANNFGNPPARTTQPDYDNTTPKSTIPAYDHNSLKEMQEAAETASFAQNQNRQYLQELNKKNFRPYPVYTPNLSSPPKTKSPTLTTLYDITAKNVPQYVEEATTKRQTLVPYTKSYVSTVNERREPYTRPGVSLLRDFLEKEKNKSISATTEKFAEVTARSDKYENKARSENKIAADNKDNFESVTKIPQTIRDDKITLHTNNDEYSNSNPTSVVTTEQSYQQRRDRLIRKLSSDITDPTERSTEKILTEKYYGDQTNRPGLVVPPSLTPKTLHSLAIYYATALDNLSTTSPPEEGETTTPALDAYEPIENSLPALFSRHTIAKYSNLFNNEAEKAELLEEIKLDPNGTYNELTEDLMAQMSQGPLASSPQIRELAQVFTHALSAYLQDPVRFRKVLSEIRPTHPSFAEMLNYNDEAANTEPTTTVNEDDEEILGFSDDHRGHRISENSVRGGKALNIATDYPTTVEDTTTTTTTTEAPTTIYSTTSPRNPFRCCGRISASYTTAPTPRDYYYSNTYSTVNSNTGSVKTKIPTIQYTQTTENYTPFRNENLQNTKFISRFGKPGNVFDVTPSTDYTEVTTFPTAWGGDTFDSTLAPITNSHQMFESKKIRPTTGITESTPVYFTETDSIDSVELENEEELQRAHSQSFVSPQSNNLRQGKQLKDDQKIVKKPAEDLEAPRLVDTTTTPQTTIQTSTTEPTISIRDQTEALTTVSPIASSVFTSPDVEKSTNEFQWPTTFGNWHSTILDPITLNDGLSVTGPDQGVSEIAQQTNGWAIDSATTPITYSTTTEPTVSSTANIEVTSTAKHNERFGKLLREPTSTEPAQDLSTVTDTIVEKAKEIMEGMNSTTTQKLMNVMKKTKSTSVKRLILLLVQTCDDDHNSTAEASKKALLEALMAVSPKDMDEIAKEEEESTETPVTAPDTDYVKTTLYQRRMDRIPMQRRGKNLNVDVDAINSLSNPTTAQPSTVTTEGVKTEETTAFSTTSTVRPTLASRRGGRKFMSKSTTAAEVEITSTTLADRPNAEARLPAQGDLKPQSDTRALELLRSLYTIAARWG